MFIFFVAVERQLMELQCRQLKRCIITEIGNNVNTINSKFVIKSEVLQVKK